MTVPVTFLFDVDNTLLDNDRFTAELTTWLDQAFGQAQRERYWRIYSAIREQSGFADYLGALQQFRTGNAAQAQLQATSEFLLGFAFERLLYPDALAAVAHLTTLGPTVIVSDGDMVFQPHKIKRSGLASAFGGRVLIYQHKQESLDDLQARFPSGHYVMIDDKPRLLAAMKSQLGARLTTVFVRQGHYATEIGGAPVEPKPDLSIARIGDLIGMSLADFRLAPSTAASPTVSETP